MALSLGGVALLFALGQGPAQAATLNVDGVTCNLINAIMAANVDTATGGCPAGNGADVLKLAPPGRTVTLTQVDNTGDYGPNGLPVITTEITISGPGTIRRDPNAPDFRMLEAGLSGALTLEHITVRGGVDPPQSGAIGGSIFGHQCQSLTIHNSTITGNISNGVGSYDCGPITISDSTISGNTGFGGSFTYNVVTISNSGIHDNQLGGIRGRETLTTIEATTISGNTTSGGVSMSGEDILVVIDSTITENTSNSNGGGLGISGEILSVSNSTISGNTSARSGGGISAPRYLYINHSTITDNHADRDGGGMSGRFEVFSMSHSLVSGNTASGAGNKVSIFTYNSADADDFNIFGHNDQSGVEGFPLGSTNIVPAAGVDVSDILDPNLADNGGPTQTHALVPGSPAIDAGNAVCTRYQWQSPHHRPTRYPSASRRQWRWRCCLRYRGI